MVADQLQRLRLQGFAQALQRGVGKLQITGITQMPERRNLKVRVRASPGQIFLRVVLPLSRPALAVTALFSFMTAWNEFILAATFLDDAARFTLPVALQRLVGEYRTEWGTFAAGALLVSVPVMVVFFALQKHLVGGLTAGGVKG